MSISVRPAGTEELGTRTEMKNLNSFNFVTKALEHEYQRQVEILESGGAIEQETRRFDSATGTSSSLRSKEDATDYRYFPDPDLVPILVSPEEVAAIRATIPRLPDVRIAEYVERWELPEYDANLLTNDIRIADFFEEAAAHTDFPKIAANLIIADLLPGLAEEGDVPLAPEQLSVLSDLLGTEEINSTTGRKVFKTMLSSPVRIDPLAYVEEHQLKQINDPEILENYVTEVLASSAKAVKDYRRGKEAALRSIIGQVMRATSGLANPLLTEEMSKQDRRPCLRLNR